MRMCRGEERMFGENADRDIDPKTYFEWRERVIKAMRLWKSKRISDGVFLKAVNELN